MKSELVLIMMSSDFFARASIRFGTGPIVGMPVLAGMEVQGLRC
jgi:hypothetical protein